MGSSNFMYSLNFKFESYLKELMYDIFTDFYSAQPDINLSFIKSQLTTHKSHIS